MKHAIPITFLPKRNLVNFFLPFFWCILVSSSCKSQNPYFEEIPHENYLWSSFVTSSYQDKKGFLWFGTGSGCHRFDGYEVKSFQPNKNSPNSLSHPVVWSITGEGDNIWIGTENGLNCLHVPTEKFTRYFYDAQDTNSISSNSIETVFVSKKSELWVGTKNGWNRKRPGANGFTRLFFDEKKPKESRGILEDKMGIIWLSAADSLFKYNPKSNEIIAYGLPGAELPESPEKNLIRVLFEDSFGSLWIGTDQNGLYCLNKKTGLITNHLFYQPKNEGSLGNNRISALEEDDQGFLWIGTYGGGLHFLNLNTGKLIRCIGSKKTIFYATVIRTILKDSAGNLWLGTEYEGFWVVKRHRKPFRNFKATESGFNTTKITGFSEGLNGKIWIASYSGVHLFDPQTESFIHIFDNAKPEEPSTIKNIFQIQRDKNEGLWVATDKALYHMNKNGEFTSIFEGSGGNNPCGSWLTAFLIDDTDQIWIGSQQGLCRYSLSEKKFQSYLLAHEPKNFNSNNSISSISKDRSKRLWICTKGGINLYIPSTDTFQYFPYEKQVHGIHEDNNGNLWLSAYQQFCTIDIENKIIRPFNGLGEKILFPLGVLSDDDGYIWFVVYEGVYRFNPLNGRYVFYNVNDGLGNGKIMAGLFYQPSDKKLFFGGIDWFSWFNPKEILQNDFIPSIQLVDFQLSNKSVPIKGSSSDTLGFKSPLTYNISYTNEIILTYKQNNFSFSFAALDYTASEKNQYRYRLIGYDQQWVYTNSGHRIATFTNLDPGRYTFEVQGSNNDGKWNFNNPATVTITIRPPWWKTWWASCLWGGLVIAILSFIRRYEIRRQITKTEARRLKELDTAKSRLYTNISHEFRTPLTVILGLLDNLTGKVYESGKESLKVIKRNAHQLLHLVNQMLDLARLDSS
ncbi:MAG: hypothetical protein KDC85_11195, partial [Saprospiraceae bacterium]|nr:hypothetical protein [Saprospiraceae bacterium]